MAERARTEKELPLFLLWENFKRDLLKMGYLPPSDEELDMWDIPEDMVADEMTVDSAYRALGDIKDILSHPKAHIDAVNEITKIIREFRVMLDRRNFGRPIATGLQLTDLKK